MAYPSTPRDAQNIPIGCVYVPGVGFVPLQGTTPINTDVNGNQSAPVSVAVVAGSAAIGNVGIVAGSALIGSIELVDSGGTNKASISAGGAIKVDNSGVTQPISAASLPLPTGAATAAKQPALGSAGTASTDVLSVQGIASMTPLKTDGSGVTQPVSGTVTANSGTSGTSTLSSVAASITSVSLLASNGSRKAMYLYNDSSSAMYLAFASTASSTAYTVKVPPATLFEMPTVPVYTGIISGIWVSAAGSARITELS